MQNKIHICEICENTHSLNLYKSGITKSEYLLCSSCLDRFQKEEIKIKEEIEELIKSSPYKLSSWVAKEKSVNRVYNRQQKLFGQEG